MAILAAPVLRRHSGCKPAVRRTLLTGADTRQTSRIRANSWTQLAAKSCYASIYRCNFRRIATVCAPCFTRTEVSHWPTHPSQRGTDNDVSHACACPDFSISQR